jgi:hypothetical protein
MQLEFGKKVSVGNYVILKYSKNLSKSEVQKLRESEKAPRDAFKYLSRGTLPYIKVSTVSGSWAVEFVIGTPMYEALDNLHIVMDDEGARQLYGVEKKNTEAIFVSMLADTTTVGDYEYKVAKMKLLSEYLERASKKRNEQEDAGKSEEEQCKESEEAVQQELDKTEYADTLNKVGEKIKEAES